jgi:hypothetical protein
MNYLLLLFWNNKPGPVVTLLYYGASNFCSEKNEGAGCGVSNMSALLILRWE